MSELQSDSPLNFAERLQELLSRVEYRLALTPESRDEIFRMRYECYLREGAIDPNDTLRYTDQYDQAPNATLLGVFIDGVLSSSIRMHLVSEVCAILPDKGAFPDLIEPMIEEGLKMIDVSRFVVAQEASRTHPGLAYLTVRGAWMGGEFHEVDRILTATRREHIPFYRRVFAFEPKSEVRDYPTLKKPVALLSLDQRRQRERLHRRYPVFMSTEVERRAIFDAAQAGSDTADGVPATVIAFPATGKFIDFPPFMSPTFQRWELMRQALKA